MRQPTKTELQAQLHTTETERTLLHIALNSVLNGECSPVFRKGEHKLRLCQHDAAHGGIVLHTFTPNDNPGQKPYTCAYYWDSWCYDVYASTSLHESGIALREAAYAANNWKNSQAAA